jgi:hypothetical protein
VRKDEVPDPPPGLRIAKPHDWTRVWARVIAPSSVKLTGFALLTWADYSDGANIRPGYPLLMRVTGIGSRTTVSNALSQMDEWGFIWKYKEANRRLKTPDEYRLTWSTIPAVLESIPMLDPDWQEPCG